MIMDLSLSEQDILNDALSNEKHLLSMYATLLAEASCQELRNELTQIITETQQMQFEILNAMRTRGWYNIKNAPLPQVAQAAEKYTQVRNQL